MRPGRAESMQPLSSTELEIRGASRCLVVLLHAYSMTAAKLRHVQDAVRQELPDADLLVPDLPAGLFSMADPNVVVGDLLATIDRC